MSYVDVNATVATDLATSIQRRTYTRSGSHGSLSWENLEIHARS